MLDRKLRCDRVVPLATVLAPELFAGAAPGFALISDNEESEASALGREVLAEKPAVPVAVTAAEDAHAARIVTALRRERNGAHTAERLPESREHHEVGVNSYPRDALCAERCEPVLVLQDPVGHQRS